MLIAIVADDLTGACDTAVKVCEQGISAQILLDIPRNIQIENQHVIAINTNSRSLCAQEAHQKTMDCIESLIPHNSTLR